MDSSRPLTCAPTATRTRDLLLRRSSRASPLPMMLQLSGQTDLSVSDCHAPPLLPSSGTQRARRTGWPIGGTTSMRTTGACQVGTSSAGSQRCLRSCMHASGCAPLLLYVLLYGLDTYTSRRSGNRLPVVVRAVAVPWRRTGPRRARLVSRYGFSSCAGVGTILLGSSGTFADHSGALDDLYPMAR